jgi:NitT/TauT family transport system permease protein
MRTLRSSWQAILALAFSLVAATVPVMGEAIYPAQWTIVALLAVTAIASVAIRPVAWRGLLLFLGSSLAAWLLIAMLAGNEGAARPGYFLLVAAAWLLAWAGVTSLSAVQPRSRALANVLKLVIPAIFGAWILIIWETVTRGAGVPFVLLPPPSSIAVRFAGSLPTLAADVNQTIFKSVLAGYLIGCGTGFATAVIADRFDFLRRGLLPIGNVVSALPIIGVAPIMVMWFGFDWPSKAAVVVIMTFFPMLVNTVAGLTASGSMERDLMRTYAAGYWQTLFKLRLPAAAPFIFNALKINSTLALIGAIVAEFFGTPIVGMGFRISTEVGRMNIDMVWAEIAVAAIAGSVFYGVVALLERAATFWHPSVRGG